MKLKENGSDLYEKLIPIYKYTLSLENALKLEIVDEKLITKEISLFNNNMKALKKENKLLRANIKSLSKIKFFNLILELIAYQETSVGYIFRKTINESLPSKIKSNYNIKEGLLFKSPISLGDIELQYYGLIFLYYSYLYEEDIGTNMTEQNENSFNKSEVQNINEQSIITPQFQYFDEQKFLNDFNSLKGEFINSKLQIINNNKNKKIISFNDKLDLIKIFKDPFLELMIEEKDDELIINKSYFILFSLYFGDLYQLEKASKCLLEKDNNYNEKNYCQDLPKKIKKRELCAKNYLIIIKSQFKNPFLIDSYISL